MIRCLLFLVLFPFPALAEEEVREITVAANSNSMIAQPHRWTSSCRVWPFDLVVTKLPEHGELVIREAFFEIGDFGPGRLRSEPSSTEETPPCLGEKVKGNQIRYRAGDAPGEDRLSFRVKFNHEAVFDITYVITVE